MRSKDSIYNVLKHKAFTLCGAAFCAGMLLCTTASCEKDVVVRYEEMKGYYKESQKLCWQEDKDSVNRFTRKFHSFVWTHPKAEEDPLYPKILENIISATYGTLIVDLDTEDWGDTIRIGFDFK